MRIVEEEGFKLRSTLWAVKPVKMNEICCGWCHYVNKDYSKAYPLMLLQYQKNNLDTRLWRNHKREANLPHNFPLK